MNRPAFVIKSGSHAGVRLYNRQDGTCIAFGGLNNPWRYRSTINKSPKWGLRTGRAVDSESRRFSNIQFRRHRISGRARLVRLMYSRRNKRAFYPGCYDSQN